MRSSTNGTAPTTFSRRLIKIDPLQPLAPLKSRKQSTASPSGAALLKEPGSKRFVVPGAVAPGRFPGLDSLLKDNA